MEQIKINSGLYQCEVVDENGITLGILTFNPRDFNLPERLNKGWKNIQKCLKDAEKNFSKYSEEFEMNNGDTQLSDNTLEGVSGIISGIDEDIKAQLDYIFDTDMSSIFGNTHLATPTKTGFLIENLMTALIPIMEREIKKANRESGRRKSKYTRGYKK